MVGRVRNMDSEDGLRLEYFTIFVTTGQVSAIVRLCFFFDNPVLLRALRIISVSAAVPRER